jgi:HEAT repeat protein
MGVDTLTRSAYRYREAAGLLFLLREDNFYNVQAGVLRCHQEWGGPRILHVLPFLLAYENELVVRYAAELLGTLAHVDLSVPERLSLPEQARLYQAGHAAITNEVRRTLPPPVDPAWDATNPLVTALAQALESARPENQRAIAQNPQAEPKQRKTALRRLAFEGSDDSWKVIADVAATEGLWEVRGWALYIASQLVPDRAESLQRAVADTLGEEGTESARQLVLGLVECETREAVLGVASVSDQVDREVLLTILEDLANSQQDPLYWGRQSYRAVRNSITAYGAIDRERGARFYHSLMRSDRPRQREVGRYGVGELRVAEAIPDLVASVVPEEENCFRPESVCIALGKIGTPEAHNALIQMLLAEPIVMKRSRAVLSVMEEVCGLPGQSPPGAWWNGWWASVAEDRTAVAERFVRAMEELAEKTTDERLAREARGRAGSIRLQVLKQR